MNTVDTTTRVEVTLADIRTSALLRITTAIETANTLDELMLLALNEFSQLLDVPISGMILLSEDKRYCRLVSTFPPRINLPPSIDLAQTSYLQHLITTRQSAQVYDTGNDAEIHAVVQQLLPDDPVRSILFVPLVAQDQVSGLLVLGAVDAPRHFTENEIALARVLASQLAAAIASFQITEAAQRRNAELATLNDIAQAVTSSLDPREVYHLVVEKLNAYFQVDAGSLLMYDEVSGELEFVMTLEAGEEKLAGVRVPRNRGVVGHVAETQCYEIVNDAQNDPRFYRKISESVGYETRMILCVPMIVKGRTIGVIELLNKRDGPFTEEDALRLSRMAATIGVAIENARLFQQVTIGRDRFEAILNSTNDGILMADMHGIVVTVNPPAAQLFHIRKEELLGRNIDALLAELHSRAIDVNTPPWFNDDQQPFNVVELELSGGAQRRFIRHLSLPVRDANSAEIGQLALFQDISKERELIQLRDDYTGMLVHDLRAPLTAIMNGIMMVKRGLGGPISPEQNELLAIAHQGSQTMLEMINTLLDISKMEQGRMTLEIAPLSPYALIDDTLDRLRVSAQNQNVHLKQHLTVGLKLIEADREKLIRVLQNLLDNAIKFSPTGADIIFGATSLRIDEIGRASSLSPGLPAKIPALPFGDWLIFWVRDQGPGVPQQYHDRIFEKFGQVRGREIRGTGLGLTFCKLAVEAHQGRIWLESVEGSGSTFAFALPLKQGNVGSSS
jgi:PAS domain S-box-containing protein